MKFVLKNDLIIQIKEAEFNDAKGLIEYVKVVADQSDNLTFSSNEFIVSVEQEQKILENFQKSINSVYAIAKFENQIIGEIRMASSSRKRTKHVGEFGMSVLKEYWNLGVGIALLEFLIAWAKANGETKKIKLSVRTDNAPAIQLYKKFNFIIEGIHKNEFLIGDDYFDTYSMALELKK